MARSAANINTIYPVGIVVWFAQNKNPNTLFPGTTWKYIGENKTIRLARPDGSDIMTIGGNDLMTLTVKQIPSHNHSFLGSTSTFDYGAKTTDTTGNHIHNGRIAKGDGGRDTISGGWGDLIRSENVMDAAGAHSHNVWIGSHNHSFSGITSSAGGDSSINITNTYIMLMGWYRTV